MKYNIVTNYKINQIIKNGSKYYRVSLGHSITLDSLKGDRELNKRDSFAFFYNTLYNANLFGQGIIGDIQFYTDHDINEDVLAFYIDQEEFVHPFDEKLVKEKGIDAFLGFVLKESEFEFNQRKVEKQRVEDEKKSTTNTTNTTKKVGDATRVLENPGNVTYADLKAYLEKNNSERLKI
jgi:hypothetical protein